MIVYVKGVSIAPMSTIGKAVGDDAETGDVVVFAGDWRPMRDLGYALEAAGEPIPVEVEDWQVIARPPRDANDPVWQP